jgi:hypothetical protein
MNRMPQVKEKLVEFNEEIDNIVDNIVNETDEGTDAKVDKVDEAPVEQEEPINDKPFLNNKEIFSYKKKGEDELKVNKIKKPKRVISDDHRERLRLGREKALATRRANALKKKENKSTSQSSVDIVENIENKDKEEVIKEIVKEKIVYEKQDFNKTDIESMVAKASAKALEDYEYVRKQRKEKKKVAQKEETDRKKIRDTIQKATTPSWKTDNPFANCY